MVELFNLFFLMKLCQRHWNPKSVTCCDSGTASPLHQGPARRWHMMDLGALLFPSPDWRDCLGTVAGPWQAGPSSMPHLDQHSALPPESITLGCDKAAHLFLHLFLYFKSGRMMWPPLPAAGDYDAVDAVQMKRDASIEVWCILQYFYGWMRKQIRWSFRFLAGCSGGSNTTKGTTWRPQAKLHKRTNKK